MALTKQDLQGIKTIVKDIVSDEVGSLAQATLKQFTAHDKRFDTIDSRFEQIDSRFEQTDSRFKKIEDQLNYQNQEIDQVHHDLSDKIDRVITMYSEDIRPLYFDVSDLKRRVTKLENATP